MIDRDLICVGGMITNSHQLQPPIAARSLFTGEVRVRITPYGDPSPSQADIQMTKAIIGIASPLGISVHDHIIVGENAHASRKGMRLI